nr:zona pellucida-binding protein, AWN-1=C2 fragment [swine, sperm, Peptide Partial, 9 aa] [Sus scrofa]
LRTSGQRAS